MSPDPNRGPMSEDTDPLLSLSRLSRRLAAETDPAAALWRLVETAREDLDLDRIGIFSLDRLTNTLFHVTGVNPQGGPEFGASAYPIDPEMVAPMMEVARRDRPYYFSNDVRGDFPHCTWPNGMTAHVVLPIIAGDELVGTLNVDNCLTSRPIPDDRLEPLFLYAGLAALPLFALYQKRERERAEALRRHLAAEVLFAVTSGRVILCSQDEMEREWPRPGYGVEIRSEADIRGVREAVHAVGKTSGMSRQRADDLALCASEAATNALLHGRGGAAVIGAQDGRLRVRVSDQGQGINTEDLPRATLLKGWSTRASMGLGFTIIHETADRVLLATGPEGTTLIIEMSVEPELSLPAEGNPLLWGELAAL